MTEVEEVHQVVVAQMLKGVVQQVRETSGQNAELEAAASEPLESKERAYKEMKRQNSGKC